MIKALIAELKSETANTKKIIEAIPTDKLDWKPHVKSTSLGELGQHIVGLVNWVTASVEREELDMATTDLDMRTTNKPKKINSTKELLEMLDNNLVAALAALEVTSLESLAKHTKLMFGEQVFIDLPKAEFIRSICFNHLYHHRGQLSVYLRLLDVKVPGMYGPTADDIM